MVYSEFYLDVLCLGLLVVTVGFPMAFVMRIPFAITLSKWQDWSRPSFPLVSTACPLMSSSLHRSYRRDMATWKLRKARFLSLSQIPAELVPSMVERGLKQLQTCLPGIQHVDNGQGQACPMPVCHRAGIWEGTAWSAFLLTGELMPSRLAFNKYLLNEWWSAPLCDST